VKQASTLEVLAERVGQRIALHVLPTMYDVRTKMARQIVSELRKHFGGRCLRIPIHLSSKLREAASYGQPVCEYDSASRGAQDFERLARYLLEHRPEPGPVEPVEAGPSRLAEPVISERGVYVHDGDEALGRLSEPGGAIGVAELEPATAVIDAPVNSRAAELVQRARALAERTAQLQQRLSSDPDVARVRGVENAAPRAEIGTSRTLAQKLSEFYGVRVTRQGTLFVQPESRAQSMCIAGDFNNWSPVATPLRRDDRLGVWQACVSLPPGRYRYRLIVDGRWESDGHNRRVETNAYGETNNIVEVQ